MTPSTPCSDLEDTFQPIAALNDLLFCERRCAMHRIEQVWLDNPYTLEGTRFHERAHQPVNLQAGPGIRLVHGMLLKSDQLGLIGKADVVEFHPQRKGEEASYIPYPIEYKRGRRRRWDNDDVQLCAQALCLEEMLGVEVPTGAIYHVKSKRRREVIFDERLRARTREAARRLHELFASRVTPPAVLKPRCRGCSLKELCMPEFMSETSRAAQYVNQLYKATDM
jgi:CRISPR-associated exonuclease Cas4